MSEVAQSCLTLCDPMDCSLPGSSVHGIFQAIVLEWIAISFSRGSSQPRDWTRVSRIVDRRLTIWAKYLNIKRESLHGEKYSLVLEWVKKIFGPSPETPPSGGMIKKAGAPWPWHLLWPLLKVLCLQGSPRHTTHASAQMSFFSFLKNYWNTVD